PRASGARPRCRSPRTSIFRSPRRSGTTIRFRSPSRQPDSSPRARSSLDRPISMTRAPMPIARTDSARAWRLVWSIVFCAALGAAGGAGAGAGDEDPTFGDRGVYEPGPWSGGFAYVSAVVLQPDGKILVAGDADDGAINDATVVRFHPSGPLDASFSI